MEHGLVSVIACWVVPNLAEGQFRGRSNVVRDGSARRRCSPIRPAGLFCRSKAQLPAATVLKRIGRPASSHWGSLRPILRRGLVETIEAASIADPGKLRIPGKNMPGYQPLSVSDGPTIRRRLSDVSHDFRKGVAGVENPPLLQFRSARQFRRARPPTLFESQEILFEGFQLLGGACSDAGFGEPTQVWKLGINLRR